MFPEDIQVVDFFCEVKDTLSVDDTLFKYKISIDKSLFIKDREGVQPNSWLLKEKTSTKTINIEEYFFISSPFKNCDATIVTHFLSIFVIRLHLIIFFKKNS